MFFIHTCCRQPQPAEDKSSTDTIKARLKHEFKQLLKRLIWRFYNGSTLNIGIYVTVRKTYTTSC